MKISRKLLIFLTKHENVFYDCIGLNSFQWKELNHRARKAVTSCDVTIVHIKNWPNYIYMTMSRTPIRKHTASPMIYIFLEGQILLNITDVAREISVRFYFLKHCNIYFTNFIVLVFFIFLQVAYLFVAVLRDCSGLRNYQLEWWTHGGRGGEWGRSFPPIMFTNHGPTTLWPPPNANKGTIFLPWTFQNFQNEIVFQFYITSCIPLLILLLYQVKNLKNPFVSANCFFQKSNEII